MKKSCLLIMLMSILTTSGIYAADVYVKAGGSGNGQSWATASGDLSNVLLNATDGTTVHIAAGEYKPSCNFQGATTNKREFRFKFSGGVTILGGYPSSGEGARDPQNNPTVLNGDLGDGTSVYTVAFVTLGSEMAVVDGLTIKNGKADSGDHFGDFSGGAGAIILKGGANTLEGSSPTGLGLKLSNCIIENCSANWGGAVKLMKPEGQTDKVRLEIDNCTFQNNQGGQSGAGLQANGYDVKVENSTFTNNKTPNSGNNGGAICVWESKVEVKNSTFVDNGAGSNGGAIFSENGTNLDISDCLFERNYAWEGGAIRYHQSDDNMEESVTINNCNFIKNVDAPSNGNGSGGAINFTGWNSSIFIDNCLFEENSAGNAGGALKFNGKFTIKNTTINKNLAGAHAGGWLDGPEALIQNVVFSDNISTGNAEGTAIKGQINDLAIEDCQFFNNVGFSILGIGWNSNARMKNVSIYDNTATALAFQNATVEIDNIIISNNKSMSKGGVINANWEGVSSISMRNATIVNNIAAAGQTNIFKTAGSAAITFDNCIVALNKIGSSSDETDYMNLAGVTVAPLYTILNKTKYEDEDDFFGSPITPLEFGVTVSELENDGGLKVHKLLGDNNPAIGTGNPAQVGTKDIVGKVRPATPSIGAWEADGGLGIGSVIVNKGMNIYPMPIVNDFTISIEDENADNASITIYSLDGRVAQKYEAKVVNGSIHGACDLPSGIYSLVLETNDNNYKAKLVVK